MVWGCAEIAHVLRTVVCSFYYFGMFSFKICLTCRISRGSGLKKWCRKGCWRWSWLAPCHILVLLYKPNCVRKRASSTLVLGILLLSWWGRFSTSVPVYPSPLEYLVAAVKKQLFKGTQVSSCWEKEMTVAEKEEAVESTLWNHSDSLEHGQPRFLKGDENSRGKQMESRS